MIRVRTGESPNETSTFAYRQLCKNQFMQKFAEGVVDQLLYIAQTYHFKNASFRSTESVSWTKLDTLTHTNEQHSTWKCPVSVWRYSQFIVNATRLETSLSWFQKDSLSGLPLIKVAWWRISTYFSLSTDWTTICIAGNMQVTTISTCMHCKCVKISSVNLLFNWPDMPTGKSAVGAWW